MSRFRAAPRQGHMDRLKRIYSYTIRSKDYAIRFRTDQPDYSFLPDQDFDWTDSVYGIIQEILPDDMPDPLGKLVITTTTMDANLNHCLGAFLAIKKVRTPCSPSTPHAFDVCSPMRFKTLWTAWCVVSTHHALH